MEVKCVPLKEGDEEFIKRMKAIVEDRNNIICKWFDVPKEDVVVNFYHSKGAIASFVGTNKDAFGVFSAYQDHTNKIHIAHPTPIAPIFGDNLDKQLLIWIDSGLIKFYLCKKYYYDEKSYRTFHGYFSEIFAKIVSGEFKDSIDKNLIYLYEPSRIYNKEQELTMVLYVMFNKSGKEFLFKNLDIIMTDLNINKSINTIYKKNFEELIGMVKAEVDEEEKKLRIKFNPKRKPRF